MKSLFLPATVLAALFLCSCDAVITKSPVAESTDSPLQERLEGTWYKDDKALVVAFDSVGSGVIGGLEWKNDEFEVSQAELNAVEIDGQYYLSLKPLEEDDPEGYMFATFRLDKENEIQVFIPNLKEVEKLISEGKVSGKVDKGRYATSITVEDVEELIKAAKPVEQFFKTDEPLVMKRLTVTKGE